VQGFGRVPRGYHRRVTVRTFLQLTAQHVRAFFTNWREYEAPWTTKLALGVRNRLKATFSRQQCCGNLGQPGC
jgi:hypothetical protein